MHIYTYIYIDRYIYTYIHIYIHIYIYRGWREECRCRVGGDGVVLALPRPETLLDVVCHLGEGAFSYERGTLRVPRGPSPGRVAFSYERGTPVWPQRQIIPFQSALVANHGQNDR